MTNKEADSLALAKLRDIRKENRKVDSCLAHWQKTKKIADESKKSYEAALAELRAEIDDDQANLFPG